MATEIEVTIKVNDDMQIVRTDLGVAVNSAISYEAMDFILLDAFRTLADKFQDKINHHKHNENLN